jgi:hypothetical protein
MSRFLIEISRKYDERAAHQMDAAISMMGSHFVTHADWHVHDGMCTGSMIAEAEDRSLAAAIVPPCMRAEARIYELEPRTTTH